MTAVPIIPVRRLLLACLLLAATPAWAIKVGRLTLADEAGRKVLKVETVGSAEPALQALDKKLVISIPGGARDMKTLKVGKDPVSQIRFGKDGEDLRVVLDLSREVKAELGAVGAKGFTVDLGPAAPGAAPAKAEAKAGPPTAAVDAAIESLNPATAGYTYRLVDLALAGDEQHSELVISADGPASYKTAVRDNGRLLVITFHNSSLAWAGDAGRLQDEAVQSVSVKPSTVGGEAQVKVEVKLSEKLDYAFQRDQNQLVVRLNRPITEEKTPKTGDLETLVSIDVQNADLVGVLKTLCEQAGFEYQFTKDILSKTPPDSQVTAKVENRPFREVVDTLLSAVDCKFLRQGNTLYMGSETQIFARRNRLPTITRTYSPKYLTFKQLLGIIEVQYFFDDKAKERIKGIVQDPRDSQRIMLIGTQDEVSDWLAILGRFDVPESGEAAASADGSEGGSSIKTQIFRLQYLDQISHNELITKSINQLYPEGEEKPQIFVDPATRTLVVTTSMKYLRKIEKLMARLDVRPEQVNIEGKIVEVNQGESQQLGIDWSAQQQQASPNAALNFDTGTAVKFTSQLKYSTVQNGFNIAARIQAMVDQSKADLVSSPNVTTNDNQVAVISTTDVQVYTARTTTIGATGVTVADTFPTSEIPLALEVTPKISRLERRVNMRIAFTLTTPSGVAPAAGAPQPTSKQVAITNVNVNIGDTAVIGGLVRQNNTEVERKVPVLGDIPLLGLLFKFNSTSKEKKEVVIFITPTIVED
jgi:type II secretory pathway component GspD/PulD (secretin)